MTDLFTIPPAQTQLTEDKNYLTELVGEGKKFRSPEDLAKGKAQSDQYIKDLESRLDEQREQYLKLFEESNKRAKAEDLVNQLRAERQPTNQGIQPTATNTDVKPSFNPDEIETFISRKIQENDLKKTQTENFNLVMKTLQEKLGSNYAQTLTAQANELGLSQDYVNQMAATHPKVFLKTFGLDEQTTPTRNIWQPVKNENNSSMFKPQAQKRSWSYYQDLKKTNPGLYNSPKIQKQMHDDANTMGMDNFADGDFHAV